MYQYWQSEAKAEVNASERKIGGADLGPVTQLFTENYMVRFLLENSLGAWWAARHPDSGLQGGWEFLRFDDETGQPAAGTFEGWPDRVAEVTVMDPCCGSGHFLVEAFKMLWAMRAEEEGLADVAAQDAVLTDNLFGLELDPRCVQIAMFAVALQAWKDGGGWRQLPSPNIACSGIAAKAPVEEWTALADGDQRLETALGRLHTLFRDADTLGSLIDPRRAVEGDTDQPTLGDIDFDQVAPLLEQAASRETDDPAAAVLGHDAAGTAHAAALLSRTYTLVTTNPPFLSRNAHATLLMDYLDDHFEDSKADLATAFLERCRYSTLGGGTFALVNPQGWLFLARQEKLRRRALTRFTWGMLARLGSGAFAAISGEVVNVFLGIWFRKVPRESHLIELSVESTSGVSGKAYALKEVAPGVISQSDAAQTQDAIVAAIPTSEELGKFGDSHQGIKTGDNARFLRYIWEVSEIVGGWQRTQSSPESTVYFGGRSHITFWQDGRGIMSQVTQDGATFRGQVAWGRLGVVVGSMSLHATLYQGDVFDGRGTVVTLNDPADLSALWAFVSDPSFGDSLRVLDRGISVATSKFARVPFDVERWRTVAAEEFPEGLPEPWSDDPTQWLFEGDPAVATEPLQVAVGRLVGFRWPEQPDEDAVDALVDDDGIVCVPSVLGEPPAVERIGQVLSTAFADDWSPGELSDLLEASGSKRADLESWLYFDFFAQHCKVFGNRPFVWHITDGRKDGFAALVNYHRLDRANLERLAYTYLGDWIERQKAGVEDGTAGAEDRLAAALELQAKLADILAGEPPLDIYVRWKSLSEQPIGWDPDLDDGVRLNIRPFVEAGVLRRRFSIHWRKDRGKNPDGSTRENDLHYTLAEKRHARQESA